MTEMKPAASGLVIVFSVIAVFITIISCKKGEIMDKKHMLVPGKPACAGAIVFEQAMEEGHDGASDEHVMICVLKPDSPAVFRDAEGKEMRADEIQLIGTKAPMPLTAGSGRATVKGKFFIRHAKSHHRPVVADVDEIKYIKEDDESQYLVTTDAKEITGVAESRRVREGPGLHENRAKDKVVDVFIVALDSPVVFTDKKGGKITAGEIQVMDGRDAAFGYEGKRVGLKGVFYKRHSVKHHADVVAGPEGIE